MKTLAILFTLIASFTITSFLRAAITINASVEPTLINITGFCMLLTILTVLTVTIICINLPKRYV